MHDYNLAQSILVVTWEHNLIIRWIDGGLLFFRIWRVDYSYPLAAPFRRQHQHKIKQL